MKIRLSLLLLFSVSYTLHAQEKLSAISIPNSPASSILGVQPSVTLAPKTYQALEATLFSNFSDSTGQAVIPNDFGLEFTPYWAKNHGLTLEQYLFPGALDQLVRTSSFSVATTQNFILGDKSRTNGLAFGYRTSLHVTTASDKAKVDLNTRAVGLNQALSATLISQAGSIAYDPLTNEISKQDLLISLRGVVYQRLVAQGVGGSSPQAVEALLNKIYAQAEASSAVPATISSSTYLAFATALDAIAAGVLQTQDRFEKFKAYILKRDGLYIDLAYAALLNFPTNDFEFSEVPRQSFWITPSYQFANKADYLKVTGVFRYQWYDQAYYRQYFAESKIYKNNFDYGLGITGDFEKFALQVEFARRSSKSETPAGFTPGGQALFTKETSSGTQYIGTFSYKINKQIALSYSLGNRFKPVLNVNRTLVSLLSLNFGLGGPTVNDLSTLK